MTTPLAYWEDRARRYAAEGEGLRAVCSYGMPAFYNASIHLLQRLALGKWLHVAPDTPVLDVGCGVGRWTRLLARRGADVTALDLAPTMLAEAARRTAAEGLRARFTRGDLASLDLGRRFVLVLGVTVLQHIIEDTAFRGAVERLALHLDSGGRLVLLEAAPSRRTARCDGAFFRARPLGDYLAAFARAGLRCAALTGVDPMPFKILVLPHYGRLPRPLAFAILALATAVSLPVDAALGRALVAASWHKVFVLERAEGPP